MLLEYYYIYVFGVLASVIAVAVFAISFLLVLRNGDLEKVSAYECGFLPFEDTRGKFDVRFYLVGILFIVFDLEITFLFPWCIVIKDIGLFGFWTMFVFLVLLTVGFIYEWYKGALEWE